MRPNANAFGQRICYPGPRRDKLGLTTPGSRL